MMKRLIGVVGAAVLVLAFRAPAQGLEVRVGANANFGTSSDFGVGPRVELGFGEYVPGLRLAADYHKFFPSGVYGDIDGLAVESDYWDAGVHVLYDLTTVDIAEGATIYAGGGLLYAKRNYDHSVPPPAEDGISADELTDKLLRLQEKYQDDSGVSFALSVGSTFNTGWTVIPFVEARYTIGVVDELMVGGGILFSTGGTTP